MREYSVDYTTLSTTNWIQYLDCSKIGLRESPISSYECSISGIEQAYDSDTISEAMILAAAMNLETGAELGEVVLRKDGIYVENEARGTGIDTPKIRLSTKNRNSTPRSDASRANEKRLLLLRGTL